MLNSRRLRWYLVGLVLIVYCSFPTRNHYWDGIGFALAIEDSPGLTRALFNPNHLFYNFFGYLIYHSIHWLIPGLRALDILSGLSILFSVCSIHLLYSMLTLTLRDRYYSVCLSLLLAFSATWWKFSTDANVYIPSVFFLMLAASKLMTQKRPNWVSIGLLHASSMLLHQIAVFFCPAILAVIFRRRQSTRITACLRDAILYTSVASGTVVLAYSWVWLRVCREDTVAGFTEWVLSNGREEFSFRSVGHNLWETLCSNVRLFFGGRISLALGYIEPWLLVMLGILLLCSTSLLLFNVRGAIGRCVKTWKISQTKSFTLQTQACFLLSWTAAFLAFLFLWLTKYPYYRLFYLPALILLFGLLLERHWAPQEGEHSNVLVSSVVFMILANWTFLIYPYSKTKATPPVHLAVEAKKLWKDDVIFFSDFNCDNWMFKYFNRQTNWRAISSPRISRGGELIFCSRGSKRIPGARRPLTLQSLRELRDELLFLNAQGKKTWIDGTIYDEIAQSEELRSWFAEQIDSAVSYGMNTRKHRIHFSLVLPKPMPDMTD